DGGGGGGVPHGPRPGQELVAKDRGTMPTRDERPAAHAVPGGIDGDVSPASTGGHEDIAGQNVDHARARGESAAGGFRQAIFAEPERVGTHQVPMILVSAAAVDYFAQRLAAGEPAEVVDPQLGDELVATWVQAADVGEDDDVVRRPQ